MRPKFEEDKIELFSDKAQVGGRVRLVSRKAR